MKAAFNKSQFFHHPQTINGKMVVRETDNLENVNSQIADLIQQVEHLETEIVAAEQRDRKEYINQLKLLKLSVQNLERLYRKFLFASLATAAFSTILCLWIGLARRSEPNQSQHNTAGAAAITPVSSPDLIEPPY
jgi:hypothetical protein